MPLDTSSAVTVPLGTTAPVGSVTVPLTVPEAHTPWACATGLASSRQAASTTAHANEISSLMAPPKVRDFKTWEWAQGGGSAATATLAKRAGRVFAARIIAEFVPRIRRHPTPVQPNPENCECRYHIIVTN